MIFCSTSFLSNELIFSDLIQKYEKQNLKTLTSQHQKYQSIDYIPCIFEFIRKSFSSPYHSFIIKQRPTIIAMSDKMQLCFMMYTNKETTGLLLTWSLVFFSLERVEPPSSSSESSMVGDSSLLRCLGGSPEKVSQDWFSPAVTKLCASNDETLV